MSTARTARISHDVSDEETVATLWDPASLWDHGVARGLPLAFRGPRVARWFLDFYDHHAFTEWTSTDVVEGRPAFFAQHGYTSRRSWEQVPGLTCP